jgi:hypothetical protein
MTRGPWLAVAALLLTASTLAWAQAVDGEARAAASYDPRLPFAIERPPGAMPILVLGINRFTPHQLARFVAGVDGFLARAAGRSPGEQLVWRVDGLRGYVSLSTSPFADGPPFLLTLRGEPVRSFDSEAALRNAVTLLGRRVLAATGATPEARPREGPFPHYLVP